MNSRFVLFGAVVAGAVSMPVANANIIAREDFAGSAIDVDFSDGVDGAPTYISGILTVSGGVTQTNLFDPPGPMDIFNYTNNGANGTPIGGVIRLDFATEVSAVGVDVHYNISPVLFELFDANDTPLKSILASPMDLGKITGYLGLDAGSISVSYALLSVPDLPGEHNLFIDNIVYQALGVDCRDFPCGNKDNKVLLCHVPPGNPENEHTQCISPKAVAAHLENHEGDHCGPCDTGELAFGLTFTDRSKGHFTAPVDIETCPADLDGNGSVGILDLLALLAAWGSNPDAPADIDGDGTVGFLEVLALLANWGPCA